MRRIAMVLLCGVAQLVACGDEGSDPLPLTCNPSSCVGCCQGNYCIETPTDSACGAGGAACFTCSVGTRCQSGRCEFPTGACQQSCASGCCEGGLCQMGTAHSACGISGQVCVDCALQAESCDPISRACVPTSTTSCNAENCPGCCNGNVCQGGDLQTSCGKAGVSCRACESDELCRDQQCVVPEELLGLMLGRVVIHVPWAMCLEATCDPWVMVTFAGQDYESSRKAGNTIVFDELLISNVSALTLQSSGFEAVLYDDDAPLGSAYLCDAVVRVTQWDLDRGEVVVDCTDPFGDYVSVAELSFVFIPQAN